MCDIVLILDSMKLQNEMIWDPEAQRFVGHIDYGTVLPEYTDGEATKALVPKVVGITGEWKQPIAYVLQDKCSASVQAQLIKDCIRLLHFEGFQVLTIVFDGTYTNQGTAKPLGCVMRVSEFQAWLQHPEKHDTKIHIIFNACH